MRLERAAAGHRRLVHGEVQLLRTMDGQWRVWRQHNGGGYNVATHPWLVVALVRAMRGRRNVPADL